jgi:integrase
LRYERFARRFLAGRAARTSGETGIEGLTSAEVSAWMLQAGSRLSVESAKREAADLRALLRFLYLDGIMAAGLGGAMPPVAAWRGSRLPQTMSAAEVDAVLGSCDRSTVSGRRDRAILVLLARLGLRSGEVAALRLGDVDWRAGEITVRGKARRMDRLPLPAEVGEALVAYLTGGRPRSQCPQLILTLYAPSPRSLAQGDSELMAQHQDLGVLPPRLPPRQAQHRHGPGHDEEDQLQAHKPKIIAGQPEPELPARHRSRDRADGVPQSICPVGAGFRHAQCVKSASRGRCG